MNQKQEKPYLVLAYYHFTALDNPLKLVAEHQSFFSTRDVTCRIYISEQGINGQMSAARNDAMEYIAWMHSKAEFAEVEFKLHEHHENVFPRTTVKYRKKLVAIDERVDLSQKGEHVSPERWKEMMESQHERLIIDVRNEYEWKIGHFKGAELPPCDTFREFSEYAEDLTTKVDVKKMPVMMYCTGGIRCELYSSILKEKGFEQVYQLQGGIIKYGLKEGNDHWLGKLFVFDDRLAIPLSEKESCVIGTCHHCKQPNDTYYNCANMDCNELFLACPECLVHFAGCCQESCKDAPRVRKHQAANAHKPFRKKHLV